MRRTIFHTLAVAVISAGLAGAAVAQPVGAQPAPGTGPLPAAAAPSPAAAPAAISVPMAGAAPAAAPTNASTATTYTLGQLLEIALDASPLLATSRAEEVAAQAGTITARAYPNPELTMEPGRFRPRGAGSDGSSTVVSIGQPIENPWLRESRLALAEQGVEVARSRTAAQRAGLAAAIRTRFFEIVRLKEEIVAYREDLQLTEQIRDRILLRTRTGEAPRFDLVRAEGEVEQARKNLASARAREKQALASLRSLVGPVLGLEYDIRRAPGPTRLFEESEYRALRDGIVDRSPEVRLARRQLEQAERQLSLERNAVLPQVTLRAAQERDPEVNVTRIGAQLTLPLVNRREGPIAEAQAQIERARRLLEQRRFETLTAFDAAWHGYVAARDRVAALEGGILERARAVVDIAEAAYRLGERGILEYLDAQRQFRLARNELIAARFELQGALSEIERLLGNP